MSKLYLEEQFSAIDMDNRFLDARVRKDYLELKVRLLDWLGSEYDNAESTVRKQNLTKMLDSIMGGRAI